jgi:hypothetical protein
LIVGPIAGIAQRVVKIDIGDDRPEQVQQHHHGGIGHRVTLDGQAWIQPADRRSGWALARINSGRCESASHRDGQSAHQRQAHLAAVRQRQDEKERREPADEDQHLLQRKAPIGEHERARQDDGREANHEDARGGG